MRISDWSSDVCSSDLVSGFVQVFTCYLLKLLRSCLLQALLKKFLIGGRVALHLVRGGKQTQPVSVFFQRRFPFPFPDGTHLVQIALKRAVFTISAQLLQHTPSQLFAIVR